VTVERITSFDDPVAPVEGGPESWLALTTELTRAAFLLSGRSLVELPRSAWPGEVFRIDDVDQRRPA